MVAHGATAIGAMTTTLVQYDRPCVGGDEFRRRGPLGDRCRRLCGGIRSRWHYQKSLLPDVRLLQRRRRFPDHRYWSHWLRARQVAGLCQRRLGWSRCLANSVRPWDPGARQLERLRQWLDGRRRRIRDRQERFARRRVSLFRSRSGPLEDQLSDVPLRRGRRRAGR